GVHTTGFTFGPQTGFTAANPFYASPDYATFTDFGIPAAGGLPGTPGFSGVQGSNGDLLIRSGLNVNIISPNPGATAAQVTLITTQATGTTAGANSGVDQISAITTPYRRFEDIAFDQYGYF